MAFYIFNDRLVHRFDRLEAHFEGLPEYPIVT